MLDSVRLLSNVVDQNHYSVIPVAYLREGSHPVDFYIQLWQSDLDLPFALDSTKEVEIQFLRMDALGQNPTSRHQEISATAPFDDKSVWKVELSEDNVSNIVTGGFRVVITDTNDASYQKILFSRMSIRKLPDDQNPFTEEVV